MSCLSCYRIRSLLAIIAARFRVVRFLQSHVTCVSADVSLHSCSHSLICVFHAQCQDCGHRWRFSHAALSPKYDLAKKYPILGNVKESSSHRSWPCPLKKYRKCTKNCGMLHTARWLLNVNCQRMEMWQIMFCACWDCFSSLCSLPQNQT